MEIFKPMLSKLERCRRWRVPRRLQSGVEDGGVTEEELHGPSNPKTLEGGDGEARVSVLIARPTSLPRTGIARLAKGGNRRWNA